MRYFHLLRKKDVSGVSGTGRVAEVVELHDGQVILSWYGQHHVTSLHPSLRSILAIHGHGGLTYLESIETWKEPERE